MKTTDTQRPVGTTLAGEELAGDATPLVEGPPRRGAARLWGMLEEIDRAAIVPGEGLMPTVVVLTTAAVSLAAMRYFGNGSTFRQWFAWTGLDHDRELLLSYVYWSCCCFLGYVLIPVATMRIFGLGSLRDVGLRLGGFGRHVGLYAALLAPVLVLVAIASHLDGFKATYPFYKPVDLTVGDLIVYELFYGMQFLFLEFFFRGYLLHVPKRRLGVLAVFVMIVPYCMLHFQKPPQEAFAAIGGGLVLGVISLRTGSIAGGCWIHLMVAWSMDALALYNKGQLAGLMGLGE